VQVDEVIAAGGLPADLERTVMAPIGRSARQRVGPPDPAGLGSGLSSAGAPAYLPAAR